MSLKSNTDTTKHYTYINSRKENRNKPKPKGQKLSPPKPHNLLACAGRESIFDTHPNLLKSKRARIDSTSTWHFEGLCE